MLSICKKSILGKYFLDLQWNQSTKDNKEIRFLLQWLPLKALTYVYIYMYIFKPECRFSNIMLSKSTEKNHSILSVSDDLYLLVLKIFTQWWRQAASSDLQHLPLCFSPGMQAFSPCLGWCCQSIIMLWLTQTLTVIHAGTCTHKHVYTNAPSFSLQHFLLQEFNSFDY